MAGLQRQIPLVSAVVHDKPVPHSSGKPGLTVLGKVVVEPDLMKAAPALQALEFAMAGRAAEQAILGHEQPGGWRGDLDSWFVTVHGPGRLTQVVVEELIGEPFGQVVQRMIDWARQHEAEITGIADELRQGELTFRLPAPRGS